MSVLNIPPGGADVFDRVRVSHIVAGGSVVTWDFKESFIDAGPYDFQLFVGRTGLHTADDWQAIDAAATDVWYLQDNTKRLYGAREWTHYVVAVESATGIYYSKPAAITGNWSKSDWRLATEIARKERVYFRVAKANRGYLLKRRVCGQLCTCLDWQTREVKRPDCPDCYGTGYVSGYFVPVGCIYAMLSNESRNPDQGPTGTSDNVILQARMLNDPQLYEYDVWVDMDTDDRYFVRSIDSVSDVRGRPIVVRVGLHLIPFSHVIYSLPIPDQLAIIAEP